MQITIMGSGGVGGYFGARLANAGHDVTFIARGKHFAAMREDGLRVESPRGDLHLRNLKVTDRPEDAGPTDLILIAVKLWDIESAAQAIKPLLRPNTPVLSLQNGVAKDEALRRILGDDHVIGGVCYIPVTIAGPGLIRHSEALQKLVFGEFDGSQSDRITRFQNACAESNIDVELSADIRRTTWEKFVFLVGLSGATCAMRAPVGPILALPRSRDFLRGLMDEVVKVARAEGVSLPEDYADDRMAFCEQVPASLTSSMHRDLDRGSRLEVQWLSGDVVARGERLGIATPCNRAVIDVLSVHAEGRSS